MFSQHFVVDLGDQVMVEQKRAFPQSTALSKKCIGMPKHYDFWIPDWSVSLSFPPIILCVFVLRTHTSWGLGFSQIRVSSKSICSSWNCLSWPGSPSHTTCAGPSSARDDPVPAPTSPLPPLTLLLTQTNTFIYHSPEETDVRKDWIGFL